MNRTFTTQVYLRAVVDKDDERVIEGIASTASVDRYGDIVEPMGAVFKLPLCLLWQHDQTKPIGHVVKAATDANGVAFRAKLARIAEPGALHERLEECWQSIKSGLVKGVSIGFRPLEMEPRVDGKGMRFVRWEWLELSACSIPANSDAAILNVKAYDDELFRANLPKARVVRLTLADWQGVKQ